MNSLGTGRGEADAVRVSGGWKMWKVMLSFAYSMRMHFASASIAPLLDA